MNDYIVYGIFGIVGYLVSNYLQKKNPSNPFQPVPNNPNPNPVNPLPLNPISPDQFLSLLLAKLQQIIQGIVQTSVQETIERKIEEMGKGTTIREAVKEPREEKTGDKK